MSIAPITGKLRKGFWRDITIALGLGLGAGYAFWCVRSFEVFFFSFSPWSKVWLPSQIRYGHTDAQGNPNLTFVVQRREEYYLKLERERIQDQAA